MLNPGGAVSPTPEFLIRISRIKDLAGQGAIISHHRTGRAVYDKWKD